MKDPSYVAMAAVLYAHTDARTLRFAPPSHSPMWARSVFDVN